MYHRDVTEAWNGSAQSTQMLTINVVAEEENEAFGPVMQRLSDATVDRSPVNGSTLPASVSSFRASIRPLFPVRAPRGPSRLSHDPSPVAQRALPKVASTWLNKKK
jgi:hypothetical protein